ncbi:MAG: hypothetical protein FJ100_17910 [Deltaproteobacteria bacterium]|nr:hypothetical protein [Deltaproteobacteria bacterium]
MDDVTGAPGDGVADLQRRAAKAASLLMLLAMLVGLLVAGAMTGKVDADPHALLASHVNAITGSAWLAVYAWSLPWVQYGPQGRSRILALTVLATYSNWLVTAGKAFWRVAGVGLDGNAANNVVFGLLGTLVVVPALAATGAWVFGVWRTQRADRP